MKEEVRETCICEHWSCAVKMELELDMWREGRG